MTDPEEPTSLRVEFEEMLNTRAAQLTEATTDKTRQELESAAKRSAGYSIGR